MRYRQQQNHEILWHLLGIFKKKTLLCEDYVRQYSDQQKEIKKNEDFIQKYKAGRKAKMARGRQKQLDRLDRMEALDKKEIKPVFCFAK